MRPLQLITATCLTAITGSALAQTPIRLPSRAPPLKVSIDSPDDDSTQYKSGWRLEFSIRPRFRNYGVVNFITTPYPLHGQASALLLEDRDGCPSILDGDLDVPCPQVDDETYLLFTSDWDRPGIVDEHGDAEIRAELARTLPDTDTPTTSFRSLSNRPYFLIDDGDGRNSVRTAGPDLSEGVLDGVGYGPSDEVPGLVVLSDVGVGKVLTPYLGSERGGCVPTPQGGICTLPSYVSLEELPEMTARNLAGLMTDVAFQRTNRGGSKLTISLDVPSTLFEPVVVSDQEAMVPPCPSGQSCGLISVDGAPFVQAESPWNRSGYPGTIEVIITVVVVEGTAPAYIENCDGNDEIDARDLECAGYRLLSNEAQISFVAEGGFFNCAGQGIWPAPAGNLFAANLDGDNRWGDFPLCPTGGGRVTFPPR